MTNEYLETLGKYIRYKKEYVGNDTYRLYIKKNEMEFLEKSLQCLESIDNANPSEALECLEKIENYDEWSEFNSCLSQDFPKEYTTIKQALLKAQEQKVMIVELCEYYGLDNLYPYDDLESIEYALKNARDMSSHQIIELLGKLNKQEKENAELKRVLSVIKEKSDLSALEMANDVNEFNEMTFHKKPYTQEEFDLVKRYFGNEHTPSK